MGYWMRCSWIKGKKLTPDQGLISENSKTDRKFKKISYPSGLPRDNRKLQKEIANCSPYS